VRETVKQMKKEGYPAAKWVDEMLKSGVETFYQYKRSSPADKGANKIGMYDVAKKKYVKLKQPEGFVFLKDVRDTKKEISKNAGASLYDIGDGVALVEFHTKMNALDDDIFAITTEALDRVENNFDGLVIGSEADNFSAGANLFMVVVAAQQGMWDTLDDAIRRLQSMNMRMRYFPKPVVVAPAGLALGGGCEVTMHASRVVASSETYIGLVEPGAGVIPASGGTKEYMRRIINPVAKVENAETFPFIQKAFLQIGQAKVATSAGEARGMGILGPQDRIVVNRDHLLTEAKREVLHMSAAGYKPPAPEMIYVAGRDMYGAMKIGAWSFKEGNYITEYDSHIATKLACIMAGGELTKPQWVSEQYILDLEREAFLSLCGEEKTQARMWSLLQTGKPLRN